MKTTEQNVDFSTERSVWASERYEVKTAFDFHVEEIRRNGFTIIESGYSTDVIPYAKKRIDEIYDQQIKEIGGEDTLIQIGEQGLARNLVQYDEMFIKMATHKGALELVRHFLKDHFTLFQINGNLNIPNLPATSTPWHRDLTFRHLTVSRPISLTAIWVLDDFTPENDGIAAVRGTHLHEEFPSFDFVDKYQEKIFAKAGSIIVLDGLLFHRSGFNRSSGRRRICQAMYSLPFMLQQISIPSNLQEKYSTDPQLRQLFGYNNMQQRSVLDWRKEKLENKRKNLQKNMVSY